MEIGLSILAVACVASFLLALRQIFELNAARAKLKAAKNNA